MTKEDEADDEEDESEETLTPGDLMAFAWQISEGMVRLLLCCVTVFKHYGVLQNLNEIPSFILNKHLFKAGVYSKLCLLNYFLMFYL